MPEPSHRTYWPSLKAAANSENVKANRSRTAGTVLTGSSVILCPAQVQSVSVTRGRSARRRSRVMLPCMDLARAAFLEDEVDANTLRRHMRRLRRHSDPGNLGFARPSGESFQPSRIAQSMGE